MYIGLEEEYFAFLGHLPQHSRGAGKALSLRLAKRYKTPCSKSPHQLEERWDSCKSVRAGTHDFADLPI